MLELRQSLGGGDPHSPHPRDDTPTEADILHQQENNIFMQLKTKAAMLDHPGFNEPSRRIIVHDVPTIADHVASPNAPLNLILGATAGLLLGLPFSIILLIIRK